MKSKTLAALMLGTLAAAAACAPPAEQEGQATAEMADVQQEAAEMFVATAAAWDAALMGHDVEGVLALFAADPAMMPPGAPTAAGVDAVTEVLQGMYGMGAIQVRNDVDGVRASGNLAVGWGPYTLTLTPPDGEATTQTGKWMAIAEKQADGTWKAVRNIWNHDAPPAGM